MRGTTSIFRDSQQNVTSETLHKSTQYSQNIQALFPFADERCFGSY